MAVVDLLQKGEIGTPKLFSSVFTQNMTDDNTRLEGKLRGGPLRDVGIYCINAARYLFRDEPVEVFGTMATPSGDERFREVPDMVTAVLRFPGERVAQFTCGFGESQVGYYQVVGTKGDIVLDPGYTFQEPMTAYITVNKKKRQTTYKNHDQLAPEVVYFSKCILEDTPVEPSGEEGLIDMQIMEAIEESFARGWAVKLDLPRKTARPSKDQVINKSAQSEPSLVKAEPPQQS